MGMKNNVITRQHSAMSPSQCQFIVLRRHFRAFIVMLCLILTTMQPTISNSYELNIEDGTFRLFHSDLFGNSFKYYKSPSNDIYLQLKAPNNRVCSYTIEDKSFYLYRELTENDYAVPKHILEDVISRGKQSCRALNMGLDVGIRLVVPSRETFNTFYQSVVLESSSASIRPPSECSAFLSNMEFGKVRLDNGKAEGEAEAKLNIACNTDSFFSVTVNNGNDLIDINSDSSVTFSYLKETMCEACIIKIGGVLKANRAGNYKWSVPVELFYD
ncbi:hypothetical protein B9J80_05435 [Vibrio sp. V12_P9A6T4]|uniref:hypothetical protein n=1 Tax=Vibrio sp. V12_P9A6T4 TaxID=1938667 RepID=UPI000B8E8AA9|nr:hypothetical protein [Vibrio sp. V12_P9A6T4]OXX55554.1 hypothetical protein B9J80_05435 [Vibrio sp. V12_P9A6T4]